MKLLFFITALSGGGAERVLVTLCNSLVERGHDIHIATSKRTPFAFNLDNRIHVVELFPSDYQELNKAVLYKRLLRNIRTIVKQVNPDIITSFMYQLNTPVILSTLGLKIPVVASEHTTFDKAHSRINYLSRFYVNRLATKTILLTQYDYDFLGKRLKNKVVIPNPISFPIHYNTTIRSKNVLAAGNMDRWESKGFGKLIELWAKVSIENPDWTLEIAGTGSESNFIYLKSLAKEYGVGKSVIFLGFQKDMKKLLQQSSVFILSSKNEGLPMVLLEAMSQGCACISFDCISGPREIITHNESGLLIEDQNWEEMAVSLNKLISDEALRNQFSKSALKEAERFTPTVIVDKWESLFKSLL